MHFEYIWKNFDRIEKATAKSYLFIYVRNRAIDYLRHQDIHYAYAEFSQKLYENYTEVEFKEQDERMMKIQKVLDGMTRIRGISWKSAIYMRRSIKK